MRSLFLFFVLILSTQSSWAQVFTVKVTDYGGTDTVPGVKNFIDSYLTRVQDKVNSQLPNSKPTRIMKNTSNAAVLANKGLSTDYASDMDVFLIGAGVGLGVEFKDRNTINNEIRGAGVAMGAMVGANMKKMNIDHFLNFDTKRLNMYLNFMKLGHQQNLMNNGGVNADARIGLFSLGAHFRYLWIEGNDKTMLGWGGVKLHWGYEYYQSKLNFESDIDKVLHAVDGTNGELNGRITGTPKYELKTTTQSIPLEISSDIRFLYIFSLYGGLGTDISYGKTTGKGKANGDVSPIVCTNGGFCGGGRLVQVQVQANLDAEGRVAPIMARGFAGLQLNLPYFNMFVQVNKGFGNNLLGATTGLKFVF